MKPADPIDAGRLTLALNELRLPAIKTIWPDFAVRADKEGWPAARFLAALTENKKVLIVIGRADEVGAKSVRNLPGVHVISPDQLNTYDVLNADDVIFSVEALDAYITSATSHREEKDVEVSA